MIVTPILEIETKGIVSWMREILNSLVLTMLILRRNEPIQHINP